MRHTIIVLFLFACFTARSQYALYGRILDSQTDLPMAKASVYFPELFRTTISDEKGMFSIKGFSPGKFLMQVSHLGYENYFVQIEIPRDSLMEIRLIASLIQMKEIVVTGTHTQSPDETAFNVIQINRNEIDQSGSLSISDALAKLPGASQLTTGAGISKPVIRGLYGNRIQVNVNGLRFDNQQWQDEHGLGLSDMGIERIEIIRGPAAVLYGSDAMGGVVNVIDEKPAPVNSVERDWMARIYSNTWGASLQYGLRKSTEKNWRKFRIGFDNHADYSDGNSERVLNSRFASYNAKFSWGRNKDGDVHVLNLAASHSLFGFVFDSLSRKVLDARLSRNFNGPHHTVSFVQVNTENTYYREGKKIKLNGGFISNLRLEDEGGGGISLSMLLNTINALGQVTRNLGETAELSYGSSGLFQSNTNFGGRIIIPDAINGEVSAFAFYKNRLRKFLVEAGLRYDQKFIETFATQNLNVIGNDSPTQKIVPFTNFYSAINFSVGSGFDLAPSLRMKANVSTGYRPGNLAELSSNGLHEGTLRWEIGLPDARIEQNLNVEGSLNYSTKTFRASVSIYRNAFRNYFHLSPTSTEFYGFAIYQYEQANAVLQGGEIEADWNVPNSRLELNSSYSFIDARKSDGSFLPFIPANRVLTEMRLHAGESGNSTLSGIKVGATYVFDQDHPAQFETPSRDYLLVHAGLSGEWKKIHFSLVANNLLNKQYYDHLSRFKYYGIGNMGRNIVLTLKF